LVLIGAGAVGAGAALVLAMGAAVQRATFEGSLAAAQVAAVHLSNALETQARSVEDLAELVEETSSTTDRAARLRTWLSMHRLVFSGLALVDRQTGDLVEIHRPRGSVAFGPETRELATTALDRRATLSLLVSGGGEGTHVVLLASPVRHGKDGARKTEGALVAWVDASTVAGAALEALAAGGEATAFVTSRGGSLLVRGAPADSSHTGLTSESDPGEMAELAGVAFVNGSATRILSEGGRTSLAVAVSFEAAGSSWVVGLARPWRLSMGEAGKFVLMAALGVVVFFAGAAGVVAGVRRAETRTLDQAEELSRWRATAAAASREAWRRALLGMPGAAVLELQGTRVVEANARAVRSLGMDSAEALAGRDLLELVVADEREQFARFLAQQPPPGGDEKAVTVHLEVPGSGRKVVEVRRLPAPGEGQGGAILLTWRDATVRERGEALSRTLASVMHVPVLFVDPSGTIVWSNQAFDETARRLGLAGKDPLEAFGSRERRLLRIMFGAALRGKSSDRLLPLSLGTGRELAVALRVAPVVAAGQVFGVVFAGQEVRGAPPGAVSLAPEHRAEALAQLAATLSHRLNNDLQALQGRIAAARLAGSQVTVEEIVAQLQASARELQRFVSVCRRSGAALRPVRLSVLLDGWRESASPRVPPGVRLVFNSEVTEDRVIVDSQQVQSFLDYALVAATRVLEGEGGAVSVAVERGVTPGTVRLSVRDTGGESGEWNVRSHEGLPDALAREAVLAVAQLVAERHGGAAGWRRTAGMGSHVWLDLPLRVGAVAEEGSPPRERRAGVVLVADDEEAVRSSLAAALREEGFVVDEASNGREVVDLVLAAPQRYALVVLDVVMPVLDGREVLRRLKEEVPALPVLLCTGYESGAEEASGGAGVLVKPFSLEAFVERVRACTGTSASVVIG
jgi:CheY-like chemotaxis protein